MPKHILTIRPAIDPAYRHGIEKLLEDMGFHIMGGGSYTDGSECDISFYEEGGQNGLPKISDNKD